MADFEAHDPHMATHMFGYQKIYGEIRELRNDFDRFQGTDFPEAVRTRVSAAIEDALFGRNSKIAHQMVSIEKLPDRNEVQSMIENAVSKLPTITDIQNVVMTAMATFPSAGQSAQIGQIVDSAIDKKTQNLPSKADVQVLITDEFRRDEDSRIKRYRMYVALAALFGAAVSGIITLLAT